jgi:hypothetical protein
MVRVMSLRVRAAYEELAAQIGEAWIVRDRRAAELSRRPLGKHLGDTHTVMTFNEAQGLLDACGSPVSTLEEAAREFATPPPEEPRLEAVATA